MIEPTTPVAVPGHEVSLALTLAELMPFLRQQLRILTAWSVLYWGVNLAIMASIAYVALRDQPGLDHVVAGFGQGFCLLFLLLLPLHEVIHAALYKLVGAPRVRFGANLRQFTFYAYADGFVVGYCRFQVVALGPFALLNGALVLGLLALPAA